MRNFILLFVIMAGLLSTPSYAQSKKELAAQNAELATRLERLEGRMLTGDPAAEALTKRLDSIEAANRNLVGEVERLQFERDSLRAEIQALADKLSILEGQAAHFQIHLDAVDLVAKRRAAIPGLVTTPESDVPYNQSQTYGVLGVPSPGSSQGEMLPPVQDITPSSPFIDTQDPLGTVAPVNDVSELPAQGREKLALGDFSGALTLFSQYLAINPEAADADEVHFWLGETYYVRGAFADAADSYIQSMRKNSQGIKSQDAMIKLAASLRELGKIEQACQTLNSFPAQYPNASGAILSKRDLELSKAGC